MLKDMTSTFPNKAEFLKTYVSYMSTQVLREFMDIVHPGGTVSNFENVICKDGVNSYFELSWVGILPQAVVNEVIQRAGDEGWIIKSEWDMDEELTFFRAELTTHVDG